MPGPQIQHAGGRVISLGIVGKAADLLHTHLLAKGSVGEGLHLYADIRQSGGYRCTRDRSRDGLDDRPAPIIDILHLGVCTIRSNSL